MTLPVPLYWRFPQQFCTFCGGLVSQEDAVAVYADRRPLGWTHEYDCTKDDDA